MAHLTGESIIGFESGGEGEPSIFGVNPTTGESLQPGYAAVSGTELDRAVELAAEASGVFGKTSGAERAAFLRRIADNIEAVGDDLVKRAPEETGLPEGRIRMETGRTCGQLRLFASVAEEGSWVDARIDHADPAREPVPKADVRSMERPLGPVAVFCASNFPLAFSVAGGDTASAFAAGCPVVVKAHQSHPGTAELVGQAVSAAVRDCGLPEGTFSLLYGPGRETGSALVRHPAIKAAGFTGSRAGGQALMKLAAERPEPIPFYAEMSSINPVFILPGLLAERTEQLAAGLHGSLTLGVGQFCTNPGLMIVDGTADLEPFVVQLAGLVAGSPGATMLNPGIHDAYGSGTDALGRNAAVETVALGQAGEGPCQAGAALYRTSADAFLNDASLGTELFGPSTLLVTYDGTDKMLALARLLEGQLTATVHGTEADLEANRELFDVIEGKVGRVVVNGFPTGVEVCPAMVHGGPFPATSDGRSTSVGTRAIHRFTRAVCYQGYPDYILPAELREANPLGIRRLVDGEPS
ncbi:MAG: aldehyde dehydrogenase (NADP(+)) [Verrucomicrobiota bacterium]|nr:aldehyde dehydrogenase (NADP(+)) [Verrucomicrobiota bacterium]MDP7048776.1 aldehyde dehydrogenase (NADP(+)) [Verrucomicrobiota bacterium]